MDAAQRALSQDTAKELVGFELRDDTGDVDGCSFETICGDKPVQSVAQRAPLCKSESPLETLEAGALR